MKFLKPALLGALMICVGLAFQTKASASTYVMQGAETDLWDPDVDYFAPPIILVRVKNTFPIHQVHFTVLRHQQVCADWEQVCVGRNSRGQCTSYQRECVQWEDQTTPVDKYVELDFQGLPALGVNDRETYQLTIQREQPAGDGEDMVSTMFNDVKTMAPVTIIQWSDFRYEVDLKKASN